MGIFKIHWMLGTAANSFKQKLIYTHTLYLIIQLATYVIDYITGNIAMASQAYKRLVQYSVSL